MVRGLVSGTVFLMAAIASTASLAARPADTTVREHRFSCQSGEQILVSERASSAAVRVGDSLYELRPKSSSLGRKFASPQATLIIDGALAVFIAADRTHLRQCYALRT